MQDKNCRPKFIKLLWIYKKTSLLGLISLVLFGCSLLLAFFDIESALLAFFDIGSADPPQHAVYGYQGGDGKLTNLEIFQSYQIFNSKVKRLDLKLLQESIRKNQEMPRGESIQKYNYVVTEPKGEIMVAAWDDRDYDANLRISPSQKDIDQYCLPDDSWSIEKSASNLTSTSSGELDYPSKDIMINIYPETGGGFINTSPCWVVLPSGQTVGFLDSSSKHLLLAQGEGASVEQFNRLEWIKAKVKGAGEIIVDLRQGGRCYYTLTNLSGTFKPFDFRSLGDVAVIFTEALGVPPAYLSYSNEGLVKFSPKSQPHGDNDPGSLKCNS